MPSSTPRLPTSPLASLALILVAVAGRWWLGPAEPTVARPRNSTEQEPAMPVALAGNNARSASIGSRAVILAGLAVVVAALAGGGRWFVQSQRLTREAAVATGGDPDRALPIMLANGCAGCHMIPGVPGAQGLVGPRLDGTLAQRVYIGGSLPNTARQPHPLAALLARGQPAHRHAFDPYLGAGRARRGRLSLCASLTKGDFAHTPLQQGRVPGGSGVGALLLGGLGRLVRLPRRAS